MLNVDLLLFFCVSLPHIGLICTCITVLGTFIFYPCSGAPLHRKHEMLLLVKAIIEKQYYFPSLWHSISQSRSDVITYNAGQAALH